MRATQSALSKGKCTPARILQQNGAHLQSGDVYMATGNTCSRKYCCTTMSGSCARRGLGTREESPCTFSAPTTCSVSHPRRTQTKACFAHPLIALDLKKERKGEPRLGRGLGRRGGGTWSVSGRRRRGLPARSIVPKPKARSASCEGISITAHKRRPPRPRTRKRWGKHPPMWNRQPPRASAAAAQGLGSRCALRQTQARPPRALALRFRKSC